MPRARQPPARRAMRFALAVSEHATAAARAVCVLRPEAMARAAPHTRIVSSAPSAWTKSAASRARAVKRATRPISVSSISTASRASASIRHASATRASRTRASRAAHSICVATGRRTPVSRRSPRRSASRAASSTTIRRNARSGGAAGASARTRTESVCRRFPTADAAEPSGGPAPAGACREAAASKTSVGRTAPQTARSRGSFRDPRRPPRDRVRLLAGTGRTSGAAMHHGDRRLPTRRRLPQLLVVRRQVRRDGRRVSHAVSHRASTGVQRSRRRASSLHVSEPRVRWLHREPHGVRHVRARQVLCRGQRLPIVAGVRGTAGV